MRVNVGAGGQHADGWTSLDRAGDVDIIRDLASGALPFPTRSVEAICAHHVLDLLDDPWAILEECARVLQLGGVLRISLADLKAGILAAQTGEGGWWFAEPRATLEETLGFFITQGGARRHFFTPYLLTQDCRKAGFAHAFKVGPGWTLGADWMLDLDSREDESFFVDAIR